MKGRCKMFKHNGKGIKEHQIDKIEKTKWFIFTLYYLYLKDGRKILIKNKLGKVLWEVSNERV